MTSAGEEATMATEIISRELQEMAERESIQTSTISLNEIADFTIDPEDQDLDMMSIQSEFTKQQEDELLNLDLTDPKDPLGLDQPLQTNLLETKPLENTPAPITYAQSATTRRTGGRGFTKTTPPTVGVQLPYIQYTGGFESKPIPTQAEKQNAERLPTIMEQRFAGEQAENITITIPTEYQSGQQHVRQNRQRRARLGIHSVYPQPDEERFVRQVRKQDDYRATFSQNRTQHPNYDINLVYRITDTFNQWYISASHQNSAWYPDKRRYSLVNKGIPNYYIFAQPETIAAIHWEPSKAKRNQSTFQESTMPAKDEDELRVLQNELHLFNIKQQEQKQTITKLQKQIIQLQAAYTNKVTEVTTLYAEINTMKVEKSKPTTSTDDQQTHHNAHQKCQADLKEVNTELSHMTEELLNRDRHAKSQQETIDQLQEEKKTLRVEHDQTRRQHTNLVEEASQVITSFQALAHEYGSENARGDEAEKDLYQLKDKQLYEQREEIERKQEELGPYNYEKLKYEYETTAAEYFRVKREKAVKKSGMRQQTHMMIQQTNQTIQHMEPLLAAGKTMKRPKTTGN